MAVDFEVAEIFSEKLVSLHNIECCLSFSLIPPHKPISHHTAHKFQLESDVREDLNNIDFMVLVHDSTIAQWLKTCGCIILTVFTLLDFLTCPQNPLPHALPNMNRYDKQIFQQRTTLFVRKNTNCIYNGSPQNIRSQYQNNFSLSIQPIKQNKIL